MIPGYLLYLNFYPDSDNSYIGYLWSGMGIFISSTLSATQTYFSNNSFKHHFWIKIDLQGQDKLYKYAAFIVALLRPRRLVYPYFVAYWRNWLILLTYIFGDCNMKDIN